ncbi:hypothetical protein GUITHDRAFT_105944 [Guillardia theta CCMP2712]|uniref:Uncharacterized protein n=2 Tax=Guillardia theta TaxID=55529 RepID=L1JJ65_GUITC|nr:hypothetical protein GUITHDRAFT_105944 [Guillardia theta CCMP2712]EKX48337.1 hypothetical protein GUITHDRAFT_105944 [Guillardia theta CCMP2712]|eukprot:XP_005835317.1 hypothetical protein GUITHDRAFT_105944 [Guillardia theta CCMP2712]
MNRSLDRKKCILLLALYVICLNAPAASIERGKVDAYAASVHALRERLKKRAPTDENNDQNLLELQNLLATAENSIRDKKTDAKKQMEELRKREAGLHRSQVLWRSKAKEAERNAEMARKKEAEAVKAKDLAQVSSQEAYSLEVASKQCEEETRCLKSSVSQLMEETKDAEIELSELKSQIKDLSLSSRLAIARQVKARPAEGLRRFAGQRYEAEIMNADVADKNSRTIPLEGDDRTKLRDASRQTAEEIGGRTESGPSAIRRRLDPKDSDLPPLDGLRDESEPEQAETANQDTFQSRSLAEMIEDGAEAASKDGNGEHVASAKRQSKRTKQGTLVQSVDASTEAPERASSVSKGHSKSKEKDHELRCTPTAANFHEDRQSPDQNLADGDNDKITRKSSSKESKHSEGKKKKEKKKKKPVAL